MSPYRNPAYTSGNRVTPYIDGDAYFDALHTDLGALTAGDLYYFTAWRATPQMPLKPDLGVTPTYGDRLTAGITAGADVKGIMWYATGQYIPGFADHALENIGTINLLGAGGTQRGILDNRTRGATGSHHQKTSIVLRAGAYKAYVGGIDIAPDRWDVPGHAVRNYPYKTPASWTATNHRPKEGFEAWHDVQCGIQGAAVAQVYENFAQRWNCTNRPHSYPGTPGGSRPTPIPATIATGASIGTHHVQLLRTLPCKSIHSFLPGGEQTIRLAYENAISKAEHYIYIEDQYAWDCTLVNLLIAAARRGVKVILMLANKYDVAQLEEQHCFLRYTQFLDRIRAGAGPQASNVLVYHLKQTGSGADIYIHSKLMIVDDCYAVIGSANINHRSHTNDSELSIAVVDQATVSVPINGATTTVCQFAHELRTALWGEHLGVAASAVADPIASLSLFPTVIGTHVHHTMVHTEPTFGGVTWTTYYAGLNFAQKAMIGAGAAVMNARTTCP